MAVFVLDKRKKPMMPCTEKRARLLLSRGRARVHRLYPFTIRLVDRTVVESSLQPIAIKIDPGSKTTGIAVVREEASKDGKTTHHVLHLVEVTHRGGKIREALASRRACRRRRRGKLRFREERFDNRRKPDGWLPPSLRSRVDNVAGWTKRYQAVAPIGRAVVETVRFDAQLLQNPEISGVEYQQGELAGYEVREYLLEKWGRCCAYCDASSVSLQIEHVHARSKGGSNRVSNLTLACEPCNRTKGSRDVREFLAHDPQRLAKILAETRRPLRDAAAVNATRHALARDIEMLGLPIERSTGGRTKFNRMRLGLPKAHALDAACAGAVDAIEDWQRPALVIAATGRGMRQRMLPDSFGFPRGHRPRRKLVHGFQTGDMIRAVVPAGKKAGIHLGRVAVRTSGSFNVRCASKVIQGIHHRHCQMLARAAGYGFHSTKGACPPNLEEQAFRSEVRG